MTFRDRYAHLETDTHTIEHTQVVYQAESPDDKALIVAAKNLQYYVYVSLSLIFYTRNHTRN